MSHRICELLQLLLLLLLPLLHTASSLPSSEKLKLQQHEAAAGQHDPTFDREMLLGQEDMNSMGGFNKEQAAKRLSELFDSSIDSNRDGKASREELLQWLERVADKQLEADTQKQWQQLNVSDSELVTWPTFALAQLQSHSLSPQTLQQVQQQLKAGGLTVTDLPATATEAEKLAIKSINSELTTKRRRWTAADKDKDGKLSKVEYQRFAFPEEFDDTRFLTVQEELDRLDKNLDGKASLDEFIADLWNPGLHNEEKEPDWVQHERDDFKNNKDINKDGFLDKAELDKYLFDHEKRADLFTKEADHLIGEADKDKDGSLSKDEMLNSIDLLAGSAVTNFGQHLRDEL